MILILQILGWLVFIGSGGLLLLSKAYGLAPYRLGWLMLLANAVYEAVEIRLRLRRRNLDAGLWVSSTLVLAAVAGPWLATGYALLAGGVCLAALYVELRWLADAPATQHQQLRGRVPLPVPHLIVTLRGPVVQRQRTAYDLGYWPRGWSQEFDLLILNPGTVRPQLPMSVAVEALSDAVSVTMLSRVASCPEPGQVMACRFALTAERVGAGGQVRVTVAHGDRVWQRLLRIGSVMEPGPSRPLGARIERWKYGCNASFLWRGDNDLYDPATFQSADGLRKARGLAARFRMPTTIMLSPRLSLEQAEHQAFCDRFGWDRHSEEIPDFIRFFREEVDMANEQEFPTATDKPLTAEIGNHMYVHYGTHAAADPGNQWKSHARMGDGNYPWLRRYPCSSFEEQRDNILKCTESIERHLGVKTSCFTIPSDVYDADTSRAVEAAGIEVGNDTDTTKLQKLLLFPKERHPHGCETLAELTRMIPKDPVNASQIAMLKFWVEFARRHRRALVYLAHHHLVMYQTNACYNLTAELLRYVLEDTEGDVHSATMTDLGRYWRDVLSSRTRKIAIEVHEQAVVVSNSGDRDLRGLPLEIDWGGGRGCMRLVDVPAHSSVTVSVAEPSPAARQTPKALQQC